MSKIAGKPIRIKRQPAAYMTDRNTLHFDIEDARRDCDGFITPLYDVDASNVALCPRPINNKDGGAACDSAAWCVLAGHCGCDHPFKLIGRFRKEQS